jgi:hypothetical protein
MEVFPLSWTFGSWVADGPLLLFNLSIS